MKALGFVAILFGILVLWSILSRSQERFVSEFVDKGNVKRTAETSSSSYKQQTNHFVMASGRPENPPGIETPFRVNIWDSFMPV
jgi:hypothetical protein